jgi:uncharacterized protein (DUF1697 family)
MSPTILLLRGVNVGGNNRLPMADLKSAARALGAARAETYLQSGNLVVTGAVDPAALAASIDASHGFAPQIMARSLDHWRRIVADNPFPQVTDPKALHVFCLAGNSPTTAADLTARAGPDERVLVTPTEVYLHTPKYLSGSLIAERMDRLMHTPTTARNWRSVLAILDLAQSLA